MTHKQPNTTPKELTVYFLDLKSALPSASINSPRGRRLYSQRIGTVEPVFGNIRHNKRLTRLNHRERDKVNTQWNLYCMVHNIEKLAKTDLGQKKVQ